MGIDGRQWNTMAFYGLTKPFQGAEFSGFFPQTASLVGADLGGISFDAQNPAVL